MKVRRATLADHAAVTAFTTGTFEWGDYVPEAFPHWLDEDNSNLLVAVDDDDTPIGVARVVMLSDTEAWFHAARVHQDHRRTGVGSAINDAGRRWAAEQGALILRLLVETWNEPAARQVEKLGYRPVSTWVSLTREFGTPIEPRTNGGRRVPGEERLRPASATDIDASWMAWSASELHRAGRGLFAIGWSFRRLTVADVAESQTAGRLWSSPSGWVALIDEEDERAVSWLVTTDLDAARLLHSVTDKAEADGVPSLRLFVPDVDWLVQAAADRGFEAHRSTVWAVTP